VTVTGGTYRELERRWIALHGRGGLRVDEIACGSTGRTLLVAELDDADRPAVTIAAGVHGDEPAGPWALLELVETQALDARFAYHIWPCTNPTGFKAGTRASADGVDVNRTFDGNGGSPEARAVLEANRGRTFALSLDLHEDCDAAGFYCYEYGGGELGRAVIAALDARGFPIDPLEVTFGLAGPLDDAHCVREWGRIVADAFREAGLLGGLSYSLALARQGTRSALTFETPSAVPWDQRVAMHRAAVLAAIAALS
jgi:murein peptide amidase A